MPPKKRVLKAKPPVETDLGPGEDQSSSSNPRKKQAVEKVIDESNAADNKRSLRTRKPEREGIEATKEVKKPTTKAKTATKKVEKPASAPSNSTTTNWEQIEFACTKKNSAGQTYNMKISCWNVGGLKSWLKKGCLQYLDFEDPDIICLQETKCSEVKLPEEIKNLKGYKQYWCSSSKEGYAGVGLLTKQEPVKVNYGINDRELDEDGRCITAEYKTYYLICVYVPNAGRKLITLPKRLEWNKAFKEYVKTLDRKKPVIICGDMNVAHNEIDLARPSSNTKNAGFTKEERDGMTEFLQEGFVDTFRKLYPEKSDAYTFWTYMTNARAKNVGWRLDYFIVSERIADNVCDSVIRSDVLGSDHCPLTLFINI